MAEETTQQTTTQQTATTTSGTAAAGTGAAAGGAAAGGTQQTQQTSTAGVAEQKTTAATEQKTQEQKTSEGQTKTSTTEQKTAGAELEIKLPEGVKVDQAVLDGFKSIAKEHGLSPKQAQALVDFQLKNSQEQQAKAGQMYQEALQKQRVADLDAIKADPKLGGANFDKTVREYRAAVQKFGGEDLRKMLEASGYDCHPAIVRTFQAISAAIGEDSTTSRITQTTTTDSQRKPMSQTERMAARYNKNSSAQQ